MGGCCSRGDALDEEFSGDEDWAQWDKHPARQHYDVFDEFGEGAFSKVFCGVISLWESMRLAAITQTLSNMQVLMCA
jgi:hypothetical protein